MAVWNLIKLVLFECGMRNAKCEVFLSDNDQHLNHTFRIYFIPHLAFRTPHLLHSAFGILHSAFTSFRIWHFALRIYFIPH